MTLPLILGEDVKEIIDTELTDDQCIPFIVAAHELVDHYLAGESITANLKKEIERWLAAHLITARDPRPYSEKIDTAEVVYQGKSGLGLDGSRYGQMVKTLDITGTLANIDKKKCLFTAIDLGVS